MNLKVYGDESASDTETKKWFRRFKSGRPRDSKKDCFGNFEPRFGDEPHD